MITPKEKRELAAKIAAGILSGYPHESMALRSHIDGVITAACTIADELCLIYPDFDMPDAG